MQVPQLRAGLGAQLADQHLSRGVVDGQRLAVPPVLAQSQHQQPVQPFPERMNAGEPPQLHDRLSMTT